MKKITTLIVSLLISANIFAQMKVTKIDPPCWFTGMKQPELQLMVYGNNLKNAKASVNYPGVTLDHIVELESPDYLLLYLKLDKEVKPGTFDIVFTEGKRKIKHSYTLCKRRRKGEDHKGFDASDALYLLMPDRFANGNPANDQIKGMSKYKVDRNSPNARHGGDLEGIRQHLDYFNRLGVTALWFTPVLENNMEGGSYHGYATTDYYRVDPRLGSNEEYRKLIEEAHQKGLKIVMDMIFNHCGVEHPWIKKMPSKEWFNNHDYKNKFVQTSFKLTPHVDPYTSEYDFKKMNDGWFVPTMPDLNQKNPHVYRYLVQNSFWWIEYADIDGIRMDTYPYADYDAMSNWMKELNEEYPNYNTVGETWVTEPAYTAWWQADSKLSAPKNSHLKSVMDFSFYDKINLAKKEDTDGWFTGLNRIYNNFVYDYLYPNPSSVLAFFENHDTDRFLGEGNDLKMLKQATVLLLTTHRIPQLYYGTEVMMNGVKNISDGYVRCDFPGGWKGDRVNLFTLEGADKKQKECFSFYQKLLHWRKGNETIAKGTMVQFMPENGIYVYARKYGQKRVLVMLNGCNEEKTADMSIYREITEKEKTGKEILTGRMIPLDGTVRLAPRESLIIELGL